VYIGLKKRAGLEKFADVVCYNKQNSAENKKQKRFRLCHFHFPPMFGRKMK